MGSYVVVDSMFLLTQLEKKMRYAKWKAVEIDRCLKSGITPTPGSPNSGPSNSGPPNSGLDDDLGGTGAGGPMPQPYSDGGDPYPPPQQSDRPVPKPRQNFAQDMPPGPSEFSYAPPGPPSVQDTSVYPPHPTYPDASAGGGTGYPDISGGGGVGVVGGGGSGGVLGPEQVSRAQKLIKFATSALDYDDTAGAVDYLTHALHLLKTGKEQV